MQFRWNGIARARGPSANFRWRDFPRRRAATAATLRDSRAQERRGTLPRPRALVDSKSRHLQFYSITRDTYYAEQLCAKCLAVSNISLRVSVVAEYRISRSERAARTLRGSREESNTSRSVSPGPKIAARFSRRAKLRRSQACLPAENLYAPLRGVAHYLREGGARAPFPLLLSSPRLLSLTFPS